MAQQEHTPPATGFPPPPQSPQSPQSPGITQSPQSPGVAQGGGMASAGQMTGPLPRASFGQRLGAFAIDLALILVVELVIGFVFGIIIAAIANAGNGAAAAVAGLLGLIAFLLYLVIPIVYFGYMEGQPSGQTVGKRVLNIRVVDFNNAGPITMGRAMLRSVVRSFLSGILLLGYLWMLWDSRQQTWHDKLTTTTVVPTSAYPA